MPKKLTHRIVHLPANQAWCLLGPDGQIVTLADGKALIDGPRNNIVAVLAGLRLAVAKDGSVSPAD